MSDLKERLIKLAHERPEKREMILASKLCLSSGVGDLVVPHLAEALPEGGERWDK